MSFTSLAHVLGVSAAALCLGACAMPPTPQSNALAPEERARAIAAISHFMSDGDVNSFDSVSKGFDAPLYRTEHHTGAGRTLYVTYRGFQKRSDAFSIDSTYRQTWSEAYSKHPTVSSDLDLRMSHDFCLTRDELRQAFGDQVDRHDDPKGKYGGLTTSKNLALVVFTDDGSCVKYISIFARREHAPKTTTTELH
ncbi:hypothetical protein [Burkholderia sp. F1]|uniref:hypothetical protein n=1 Tax=Burkholderia sp. F1 TaxID=3366817 RepID=UPI003D755727